jgi:hypothetical protein
MLAPAQDIGSSEVFPFYMSVFRMKWRFPNWFFLQEQVRKQHTERAIHFLTKELKNCTKVGIRRQKSFLSLQYTIEESNILPK